MPLAFTGNLALFLHGYPQAMQELRVVVERRYWAALAEQTGWARAPGKRPWLEHLTTGLQVLMLPAGEVVLGGPVCWPLPPQGCEVQAGYPILDLNAFLETECAHVLNSPVWWGHAANVQDAIKGAGAALDRGAELHPYVTEKYEEIWALATTLDWVHELPPERRLLRRTA